MRISYHKLPGKPAHHLGVARAVWRWAFGGWYELDRDFHVDSVIPGYNVSVPGYIRLEPGGTLTVYRGYAWDGPSGPTVDTSDFMPGSLAHDAGYQLIRAGLVPMSTRAAWDRLLWQLYLRAARERLQGRPLWRVRLAAERARAWYIWAAVRACGRGSALPRASAARVTA